MSDFRFYIRAALQVWVIALLSFSTWGATTVPSYLVHQYPNGTWMESLSVRSNGLILATDASNPNLYSINPFHYTSELVFKFPNATGAVGITEVRPDVFRV